MEGQGGRPPNAPRNSEDGRKMPPFLPWLGLAFVALLSPLAATPAAARDNPFPEIMNWYLPQSNIMKRDYGSIANCGGLQHSYDANEWPHGTSIESLQQIDNRLKKRVFFRPDPGADTWTPLTAAVIEGKRKPAADCDDVAVTSAQLAVCAGFPASHLGLLVTQLPTRQSELHIVAFYSDAETGVWVFGDTMGKPRSLSRIGQTLHYYAFIDDITKWWALRDPKTGRALTGSVATSSIPDTAPPLDLEGGSCPAPDPS